MSFLKIELQYSLVLEGTVKFVSKGNPDVHSVCVCVFLRWFSLPPTSVSTGGEDADNSLGLDVNKYLATVVSLTDFHCFSLIFFHKQE